MNINTVISNAEKSPSFTQTVSLISRKMKRITEGSISKLDMDNLVLR